MHGFFQRSLFKGGAGATPAGENRTWIVEVGPSRKFLGVKAGEARQRERFDNLSSTAYPCLMSWLNRTFLILNGMLFAALLLLIDAQGAALLRPGDWEYKDLVSVMLTTVGAIVTFIGIIVAVAAIWGYPCARDAEVSARAPLSERYRGASGS